MEIKDIDLDVFNAIKKKSDNESFVYLRAEGDYLSKLVDGDQITIARMFEQVISEMDTTKDEIIINAIEQAIITYHT